MDPKIEWINPSDAVEPGTRRGRKGFEVAQSSIGRAYSSIGFEIERQVEIGDTVVLIVEMIYQGRSSGIEVPQPLGLAFTIDQGKVVRFEWSRQPEELLERILNASG
jgi:hypothetical protein